MPLRRRMLTGILAACSIVASISGARASAVHESPSRDRFAMRAMRPDVQRALTNAPGWRAFTSRHRGWNASWNETTKTPHRAFGPSIPLAGFANDPASADAAVRRFIASNSGLFGGSDVRLERVSASQHGGVWYVRYRQTIAGVPVERSDWEFRLGTDGRLMLFGADAHAAPAGAGAFQAIPASVATASARAGLPADAIVDPAATGQRLCYLPIARKDGGEDLRLVWGTRLITPRTHSSEKVWVDARTGDVLSREDETEHAITGTVKAQVHATLPSDPLLLLPVRHATVQTVGNSMTTTIFSDSGGAYSITPPSAPVTLSTSFSGRYCAVTRLDGSDASFSKNNVSNPSSQPIVWSTSSQQDAERDAYYHVNLAHDWVKGLDPTYVANDFVMPIYVNDAGADCDASYSSGDNSITFYLSGSGCPNTATMPDIVWHEYGHSVNYNLYFSQGATSGIVNDALDDGLGDAFAALMGDDPLVGNGFFGAGTYLRTVATTARWPEDASPSAHTTGQIIAGALWDLKLATTTTIASKLMHKAKYGVPDDTNAGIAMSEYFLEVLIADDDDADLSNGTPHSTAIINAFNAHGIGTGFFINAVHTAIDDPGSDGPFPVTMTITYGGPIGGFASGKLYYSANRLPWIAAPLQSTGNPDEYAAEIPVVSYGVASYYIVLTDSYGGQITLPPGAPSVRTYQFIAGAATSLLFSDMEVSSPWTVGFSGDGASNGVWERVTPSPTGASAGPHFDHTPAGTKCWTTGLDSTDTAGTNDVDGGKTTLVTNTFNATPAGFVNPIVTYWRWYSNDVGTAPGVDPWRVFISNNNGSTWSYVENTTKSSNDWQRVSFSISDYVTPTSTMKMRFVANDTLDASLVEAAVDDWYLVGYSTTLGVDPSARHEALAVQPAWPNPFRASTSVRFMLPVAGHVELSVFDLQGRKIRTLVRGDLPAGAQTTVWDGHDESGRRVSSGPYYVRLTRGNDVLSRSIVLLR